MTRQTSVDVYRKIRDEGLLSRARLEVYETLYEWGPLTGSEINQKLDSKSAHKRLSELLKLGVIREAGIRECWITSQRVISWDVTDSLPREIPSGEPENAAPRPTRAEVESALASLQARHEERPLRPEVLKVVGWLRARFLSGEGDSPSLEGESLEEGASPVCKTCRMLLQDPDDPCMWCGA